jgi:quercetin dioxygenase-like cupin family protein
MAKAGDVFQVFANTVTIKVAGADSGGALAMFVEEAPPRAGVPMHVHRGAAETAFVLQGRYKISVGGELREVGPGEGVYLPADIPHAYTNVGDQPGQLLFTIFPSGLEDFFAEISRLNPDPATDMPEINRLAAMHRLEIVGPPID